MQVWRIWPDKSRTPGWLAQLLHLVPAVPIGAGVRQQVHQPVGGEGQAPLPRLGGHGGNAGVGPGDAEGADEGLVPAALNRCCGDGAQADRALQGGLQLSHQLVARCGQELVHSLIVETQDIWRFRHSCFSKAITSCCLLISIQSSICSSMSSTSLPVRAPRLDLAGMPDSFKSLCIISLKLDSVTLVLGIEGGGKAWFYIHWVVSDCGCRGPDLWRQEWQTKVGGSWHLWRRTRHLTQSRTPPLTQHHGWWMLQTQMPHPTV